MEHEEQLETLASKLLERGLVSSRDEALILAEKFLEMDVRQQEQMDELAPAVIGSNLESAPAAEQAYASVLYYERIALEPTGRTVFANARVEAKDEPIVPTNNASTAAVERMQKTTIDLSQMFNVANLKKHPQES